MKYLYLLLVTMVSLTSCETRNKCEDLLCTSPIPGVGLDIVSFESGENLFVLGGYTIEDVTLLNEQNESLPIQLDLDNNLVSAIGDIGGNNKYRLFLSPDLEILIEVNVTPADGSCCSAPTLESFKVLNYEFEEIDIRTYKIFIK